MIPLAPPLRLASADDASVLARLLDHAGGGLLLYVWTQLAEPGTDPWEYGARLQAEKVAKGQVVVVDEGNGPIAGLTGYATGSEPKPLEDLPPVFVPLWGLWNLALPSWYINMLSALPEARNRGLGTRLLGLAEEIARDQGVSRLSLIVADSNAGARRLYKRHGYAESARRRMVKNGWQSDGTDWLLLTKDI